MTPRQIKAEILDITGWSDKQPITATGKKTSSEYQKQYDRFRNRFRNYETLQGAQSKQSPQLALLRIARKARRIEEATNGRVTLEQVFNADLNALQYLNKREQAILGQTTVSTGRYTPTEAQKTKAFQSVLEDFSKLINAGGEPHRKFKVKLMQYIKDNPNLTVKELRAYIEEFAKERAAERLDEFNKNRGAYRRLRDVPSS